MALASTEPTETPSSSASGRSESRWASVAWARALTSSGVTKVRPFIHAQAREVASSAVAPRGLTPSESDGAARAQDPEPDRDQPHPIGADDPGRGVGQIEDPVLDQGAAVIDPHLHLLAGIEVGDCYVSVWKCCPRSIGHCSYYRCFLGKSRASE